MILSMRSGDFVLGARLEAVTQIIQLLTDCVEPRNIDVASSSGCPDF